MTDRASGQRQAKRRNKSLIKLLEFPHSHYCEKVRWALDYKGIPFESVPIMPGLHMMTVRRYAPDTSVPVLIRNGSVVQGSSQIINYLDEHFLDRPLTPVDARLRQACLKLEIAMDNQLGENIRRILYHRLLAYPDFIRYCFTHPMPVYKQWIFSVLYPVLRYKIYHIYVISDGAVNQAFKDFALAMQELQQRLKHRAYLFGDQFSRADLSVASMLAFINMPAEHPFPWIEIPDAQVRAFYDFYQEHPIIVWANGIYRKHRLGAGYGPSKNQ